MHLLMSARIALRLVLGLGNLLLVAFVLAGPANAGDQYVDREGWPVGGYDVVSYHTEVRPVPGLPAFTARYNDADWYFASEASRAR